MKLRKPGNTTFNILHGLPLVLLALGLIFGAHMGYQVAVGEREADGTLVIAGLVLVYFAYRARFSMQMLFADDEAKG